MISTACNITLCLIVKNEEKYLEACLRSVQDICADIVIVDTGSSDATIDIATRYTSQVFSRPFADDFSAARNAALDHVRTDWVLFLDADEQFAPDEAAQLPAMVRAAPADVFGYRVLRYNFFATGGFYSGRQLKLFRHHPQIRYRRKINESVTEAIGEAGGTIADAPVILNHFGHCRPLEARTAKAWRYINLMKAQLADKPHDAILHGYIGLILRTLGHFAEAVEWSQQAIALAPNSATVQAFHGHVLRSIGDLEGASKAYRQATLLRPNDGAAWNMVGVIELTRNNLVAADAAFTQALEVDPLLVHVLINQGMLAQARGDWEGAAALYATVAQRNPAFLHEEWPGRIEHDPFREFYYETVTEYPGLGYLLSFCQAQAQRAALQS